MNPRLSAYPSSSQAVLIHYNMLCEQVFLLDMICRHWMAFKVLGTDDNHSFASVMRMSQKQLCDPIPWFKQPTSMKMCIRLKVKCGRADG